MAAELKIGIGADNSGLKQGLQDAEAQISAFVSKVGKIGQIGEQLSSIGQKMTVGLTLPILALGGSAVKAYGDIQSLQKGLEAVMGSAGSASKEFERLKEVAKLPGLGMQEAVKGSINLQAIGLSADKSRGILQQFGNAVASVGKGKAEFERAIYGVQQLANTDFPLGEDLNIIKDALPQVSNLLKEAFGSSRSDELAKMGVSSKQVLDTITAGLEKLPRVTGGINGAFENLGDSMKTSLARIGKIIDDTFDISGIIEKLTGYLDTAISAFESLSPAVQKTILVVAGLVAAAGPLLVVVGGLMAILPQVVQGFGLLQLAITKAGGAMALMLNPITLVTVGIAGIIALVVSNWSKITPYLVRTANNFIQLYNESQTFRAGILSIGFAFESLYAIIKSFAKSAWQTLMNFGKGVLNLFEGVSLMIRGAFNKDPEMISKGWAKANEKVVMSFDNVGLAIGKVYDKYDKLAQNKKPLKFVTEADLNINEEKIADSTEKAVTNGVQKGLTKAADNIKGNAFQLGDPGAIKTALAGFTFDDPLDSIFTDEKRQDLLKRMQEIPAMLTTAWEPAKIKFEETKLYLQEWTQAFNQSFKELTESAIGDSITDLFGSIGEAIGSGGDVIGAIGQSVLRGIGGFLSQLGGMMVKFGLAAVLYGKLEAILAAAPDPASKIAAGLGMIAAGAMLSLAGGAIRGLAGGSSGSRGGGGGSVPSGGGNSSQSYSSTFSSGTSTGGPIELRAIVSGQDLLLVTDRARDKNTRLGG